jgi:tetratricopeptide (TPR) repeat protein
MKKHIYVYFLSGIAALLFFGCEKMLDITPEDKVTGNNFWKEKGQIESSIVGAYSRLQGCLDLFYAWGELRSEIVAINKFDNDRSSIHQNSLSKDNGYCGWGAVYSTINQFNYVIDYAPMVRALDKSFTETELDYFLGEAKTMRALCYFYLARTFQTFPYITVASKNDEQDYSYAGLPGTQALDSIVKDLLWAESRVRDNFDDVTFSSTKLKTCYEKGRVTKPMVWALLADVYLTQNKYPQALEYVDKIIGSGRFSLAVDGEKWFDIFSLGNTSEGIFELQFSREYNNAGDFLKWFSNQSSVGGETWYQLQKTRSTQTCKYWQGSDYLNPRVDNRGAGGTYLAGLSNMVDYMFVWKWCGKKYNSDKSEDYRDGNANDPNWIFYRLADVCLMKAEALNRLGRLDDAVGVLREVRQRVGVREDIVYKDMVDLENQILDERAAELAFEGKRWFDLVRIARRQDNVEVISQRLTAARYYGTGAGSEGYYKAKVSDPLSWYFPIHKSEMDKNPNLVQNPYYK